MTNHPRTPTRRLAAVLVALLLAFVPAVAGAAPAQASPSAATVKAYEYRVVDLIRAQRARQARPGLSLSLCPTRYAKSWAGYLAPAGYFYHRSMTSLLTGCRTTRVAENIARGNVTADRIVAAWMASPGHRANILDGRLHRIGVGAVYARGAWTVVADFTA